MRRRVEESEIGCGANTHHHLQFYSCTNTTPTPYVRRKCLALESQTAVAGIALRLLATFAATPTPTETSTATPGQTPTRTPPPLVSRSNHMAGRDFNILPWWQQTRRSGAGQPRSPTFGRSCERPCACCRNSRGSVVWLADSKRLPLNGQTVTLVRSGGAGGFAMMPFRRRFGFSTPPR